MYEYFLFYFVSVKAFQQELKFLRTSTPDSLLLRKRSKFGVSEQDRHDEGTSKQGTNIGQMTQTVNN